MGNSNGKDSHGSTACSPLSVSPLDFFHTPPTSPSEAELSAMALSSSASSHKAQAPPSSPPAPGSSAPGSSALGSSGLGSSALCSSAPSSSSSSTGASAASPITEWARKITSSSDWAVISVESHAPAETGANDAAAAARPGKAEVGQGPPVSPPLWEQSWQERDSGVEPQGAAERAEEEEMTQVLLSLMEHQRASLGLSPKSDLTSGAVELLRRLISERDELVEEVDTLKETLRRERLEWRQFQCDLQVAVSVADRLRTEAEQALGSLRESHKAAEQQLVLALGRQQEKDRELDGLRAEHGDVLRQLHGLTLQWEELRSTCRARGGTEGGREGGAEAERRDSGEKRERAGGGQEEGPKENGAVDDKGPDSKEGNGAGGAPLTGRGAPLTGRGVAEGYLRNLAAQEKKKKDEEGRGLRDPRRIVMLSERSWSLSRLPLPVVSSSQNGAMNTSTTLPLCKKEQPAKGRRLDRILQRQESWSSFNMGKQEEDQSSDYVRPQDGFSALLRRHGGSRRNSLLRWCQGRTQGYKNIEITNFSSSWEDGLAFCAVYHTYLPTHIPFESLGPEDKKENLDLAFKTGASVGITATLTVEEMLKAGGPDWQKVLGYVESIFRHFEM